MSTVSSTASSLSNYATQLAQGSALKRSLIGIGNAVESGNLTSAGTLIAAFMKQNPQYSASASGSSQDPISKDFQTLATSVSTNQLGAARNAWTRVKSDLSKDGVNLSSPAASTAALLAQNKASIDQQFITNLFGNTSGGSSSLASLLSGSTNANSSVGLSNSILSNWVTYQEGGNSVPSTTSGTIGNILNTAA